jgi:GNAT superfamily N-acetyltransferase
LVNNLIKERRPLTFKNYEIQPYCSEFYLQVVDLLKYLLSSNQDHNKNYFNWKYNENPNSEFPLGIIALHKKKVVGFRGYCPLRFGIKGKDNNKMIALIPGDTCVHPDHRLKGLSVEMGNKAAEEYTEKYPFFLNLTATRNSIPGYLKMGFFPFASKVYLTKCNALGLAKYLFASKRQNGNSNKKIPYGTFDDIMVSPLAKTKEMEVLIDRERVNADKIVLSQDENFLRWRFSNKWGQYIFLYYIKDKTVSGYVIMRLSQNKLRGFIVDYAGEKETYIESILKFIIKTKCFEVISIYSHCVTHEIEGIVQNLGFKKASLFRSLERKINGELPLLIRPVKQKFSDNDFWIEGLDLRKIENWHVKGICYNDI